MENASHKLACSVEIVLRMKPLEPEARKKKTVRFWSQILIFSCNNHYWWAKTSKRFTLR